MQATRQGSLNNGALAGYVLSEAGVCSPLAALTCTPWLLSHLTFPPKLVSSTVLRAKNERQRSSKTLVEKLG
eukprot:gene18810-biopygen5448